MLGNWYRKSQGKLESSSNKTAGYMSSYNSHVLLPGTQNDTEAWETAWQYLTKLNIHLPCDPLILPREVEVQCSHKELHANIPCSFIHKHQEV